MTENLKATEIFVPTDFPTVTYVNRSDEKNEKKVRDAFETPKTVISVSGPSKTGKTVLVKKALGEDNIIPIYGAQIKTAEDVWTAILNWIEVPSSGRADYTSLLKQMHAGPRIRGTERKTFQFRDGSEGDAYRAALLAVAADPPTMEMNYSEITKRIEAICVDDKPSGSSITESYKQIEGFAHAMFPDQKIIEWDADAASGTISIIDPYFLFFLRSSDKLSELGRSKERPSMPLFDNDNTDKS